MSPFLPFMRNSILSEPIYHRAIAKRMSRIRVKLVTKKNPFNETGTPEIKGMDEKPYLTALKSNGMGP